MSDSERPGTTQVTLIQLEGGSDAQVDHRVEETLQLLIRAPSAHLYLLPEVWNVGYFAFDRYKSRAETLAGPTISSLREFARRQQAYVLAGSIIEKGESGELYNTCVLIDDRGEFAAVYRKVHLFGYDSKEAQLLTAGTTLGIADTHFGRVGIATCYDLRFPEQFRAMAWQGVEIFLVPSAWPAVRSYDWEVLTSARAMENQAFLIACNAAGEQEGTSLAGHSRVIDPRGKAIAEAGHGAETLTAQVDSALVRACRKEFPALSDSRSTRYEAWHEPVALKLS